VKRARELVEQFERRAGHEIDLSMWMSYFSSVLFFLCIWLYLKLEPLRFSYDFMGEMA
jgi:hypothetical protein